MQPMRHPWGPARVEQKVASLRTSNQEDCGCTGVTD